MREDESARRQAAIAEWARRWRISPGMNDAAGSEFYTGASGDVGPGWIPILERLAADLVALGWDRRLDQVEEKLGELRFYVGEASEAMARRIDSATRESTRTCAGCGAPATPHAGPGRRIVTLCGECEEPPRPEDG